MRHHPHRIHCRILRPDAVRMQRIANLHRRLSRFRAVKDHNVRPHFLRIDTQPGNSRNAFRQPLRIFMIDMQSLRRLLQRNQSRRCDHSGLPHPAAEHLPVNPRPFNKRFAARDHRTHRRAQSLRQAKHHRIYLPHHLRDIFSQRRRRIENPRAVQVHLQFHRMRVVANLFHLRRRINSSAPHVHRILQADQRRLRVVINFRSDARLHLLPRQNPIFAPHRSRHATRKRGHRRQLVQIHMAPLFADHFVAVMRPHFDRDEIPHTSRRHKQRRFFPKNLRRPPLQPVDRRIFSIHVVADLGFRHRPPHFRRRPRHRIAPQVHHSRRNLAHLRQLVRVHPLIPLRHRITHIVFLRALCAPLSVLILFLFLQFSALLSVLGASALSFSASVLLSLITSLLLHLINSTNTSLDTASRSLASRTTPPSRSTNPAIINGSNRDASVTPYSCSIRPKSIPSNCRNPKNNSSSSALSAVNFSCCSTGNRPRCIALT